MTGAPGQDGARPLRRVAIAGGGTVAWCAAAALRRHAPFLDVTVLASPPPADALADRIESALPSLQGFHADVGLSGADAVGRTGSGPRLGTLFAGWAGDQSDYVHAYGPYGRSPGAGAFHLHWVRAAREGRVAPFDAFSAAAALGRAGRIATGGAAEEALGGHEAGLSLDVERHRAMMRAYALHLGACEIAGNVEGARVAYGRIAAAMLAGGRAIEADLFVDATGPAARLRSALPASHDDWSRWLPCDRALLANGPAPAAPSLLDWATALPAGWRWSGASPTHAHHGIVWSSAHATDAKAARQLRVATGADPAGDPVRITAGALREPWAANCVAIGDAAAAFEPLEWCNLHMALSAIDRLVHMLPDAAFAPVELADYNRQTAMEAARMRDFLALHYAVARREEPMWRDLRAVEPPASLSHTLEQFRSRGRLPFFEEETFARDGWLAVLFGQGELPARVDPLVEAVPSSTARAAMDAQRAAIAAAVPTIILRAAPFAA